MYIEDTIEVINDGEVVADLSGKATTRSITKIRNRADSFKLSFDIDNLKEYLKLMNLTVFELFKIGSTEIRIRWNGVYITAGKVIKADIGLGDTSQISITCVGWLDLLNYRFTDSERIFNQVDAGEIAMTLISEAQADTYGDLGITQGSIITSVLRDRTYNYKNIKEAIIQLSEVENGFDFDFSWDKKFNVYYPKQGRTRDDIVLSYPGNIKNISFERDATKIFNKIIGKGNGYTETVEDLTSQAEFTIKEQIISYSSISTITGLQENLNSELEKKKEFYDVPDVTIEVSVDPIINSYSIGDSIQIVSDEDVLSELTGYWRVESININLSENNTGDVKLGLMK